MKHLWGRQHGLDPVLTIVITDILDSIYRLHGACKWLARGYICPLTPHTMQDGRRRYCVTTLEEKPICQKMRSLPAKGNEKSWETMAFHLKCISPLF